MYGQVPWGSLPEQGEQGPDLATGAGNGGV